MDSTPASQLEMNISNGQRTKHRKVGKWYFQNKIKRYCGCLGEFILGKTEMYIRSQLLMFPITALCWTSGVKCSLWAMLSLEEMQNSSLSALYSMSKPSAVNGKTSVVTLLIACAQKYNMHHSVQIGDFTQV